MGGSSDDRVCLQDYVDTVNRMQLILGATVAAAFATVIVLLDKKNAEAVAIALAGQEKATKVALDAATEKGVHHNGLIDRMRELAATYITKGNVYSALIMGGVLCGIYFGFGKG